MAVKAVKTVKRSKQNVQQKGRQFGFIHALMLISIVLAISLWGMSEILQRSVEKTTTMEAVSGQQIEAAKEALISYATLRPEKLNAGINTGGYNAFDGSSSDYPFQYFSLPCPVVGQTDRVLDGVSDIITNSCADGNTVPLDSGSRFGRLPWRSVQQTEGGVFQAIRGVGDEDFRDTYGQRFWYVVSNNVVQKNDGSIINPHIILRMTTGWLTVRSEAGDILSDRVAAIVIAPGTNGSNDENNRISEETLYAGEGSTPHSIVSDNTISNFHKSYLDTETYSQLVNGINEVVVVNRENDSSADQISYLTIDELMAANNKGIKVLEATDRSFYDLPRGEEGFSSFSDIFDAQLLEHGALSAPADFNASNVTSNKRLPGSFGVQNINITFNITTTKTFEKQIGLSIRSGSAAPVRAMIYARDIPPVTFLGDVQLIDPNGLGRFVDGTNQTVSFPYNNALYSMETQLNNTNLSPSIINDRKNDNHYPLNSPIGIETGPLFELDTNGVKPNIEINTRSPLMFYNANSTLIVTVTVAISQPMDAYIISDDLGADIASSINDNNTSIYLDSLPPYAKKVRLPAGTLLTIDARHYIVRLPRATQIDIVTLAAGTEYDRETGLWAISKIYDTPAILEPIKKTRVLEVAGGVPDGTLVKSGGDFGWFPVTPAAGIDYVPLGATVRIVNQQPVSKIVTEMAVYTQSELTLLSFAPDAQPYSEPYDNATFPVLEMTVKLPTPYLIPLNSEFILPSGADIIYPKSSEFVVGIGFSFPDGSVVRLPAGSVLTVNLLPNSILPDGTPLNNSSATVSQIRLFNGGVMRLNGVTPILNNNDIITSNEIFSMDVRRDNPLSTEGWFYEQNGFITTLSMKQGETFYPLNGARYTYEPNFNLIQGDQLVFTEPLVAEFNTRPHRLVNYYQNHVEGGACGHFIKEAYSGALGWFFPLVYQEEWIPYTTCVEDIFLDEYNIDIAKITAPNTKVQAANSADILFDERTKLLIPANYTLTYTPELLASEIRSFVAMTSFSIPQGTQIEHPFPDFLDNAANSVSYFTSGNEYTVGERIIIDEEVEIDLVKSFHRSKNKQVSIESILLVTITEFQTVTMTVKMDDITQTTMTIIGPPPMTITTDLTMTITTFPVTTTTVVEVSQYTVTTSTPSQDDLVTVGWVKSHLILKSESEVFLLRGAETIVIKPGSYIDVVDGIVHSPTALRVIPEVREHSDILSNENMYMYFPDKTELYSENGGGAYIEADNRIIESIEYIFPPLFNFTIALNQLNNFTSTEIVSIQFANEKRDADDPLVSYVNFDDFPLNVDQSYNSRDVRGEKMIIPAGSFVVFPPASRISPLSRTAVDEGITLARVVPYSDNMEIPPEASLLVLPGDQVTLIGNASQSDKTIEGPAYTNFGPHSLEKGKGVRFYYVDLNPLNSPVVNPFVFFDGEAVIADRTVGNQALDFYKPIPKEARIDIYGRSEIKGNRGFQTDFLQVDARSFYENFPMMYAVAPECADGNTAGKECAEKEGEGLTFIVEEGENFTLQKELIAPDTMLLTTSLPGASLNIKAGTYGPLGITATIYAKALRIDKNGDVIFHNASDSFALQSHDRIIVESTQQDRSKIYGYLGAENFNDSRTHLNQIEIDTLTIYVGGHIGENYSSSAKLTLDGKNLSITTRIGAGTKISGGTRGDALFGKNSLIETPLGNVDAIIDLSDYRLLDLNTYKMHATVNSGSGYVTAAPEDIRYDRFNDGATHRIPGEYISFRAVGTGITDDTENNSDNQAIIIATDAEIAMEPGYLWQGYMPMGATLSFSRNTDNYQKYALPGDVKNPYAFSASGRWPDSNLHLRIHPTLTALNFFGSGLERPEGLDGISPGGIDLTTFAEIEIDGFDVGNANGYIADTIKSNIPIIVRVHDVNSNESSLVTARWNPVIVENNVTTEGLRWNAHNHPFKDGYSEASYAQNANGAIWTNGEAENSYIDNFMCKGVSAQATFNMPAFPIQLTDKTALRTAWNPAGNTYLEPSASYSQDITLGVIATGTGSSFDFAPESRPAYNALTNPVQYNNALIQEDKRNVNGALQVVLNTDFFFFIDRAFNTDSLIDGFPIAEQKLKFGTNFDIGGPGAIVPPFSAQNETALAQLYSERSFFFKELFNTTPLNTVFDAQTGDCNGINDCAAMFNRPEWQGILNGVAAFDLGVGIKILNAANFDNLEESPRVIMPQPSAVVKTEDNTLVTIYAGSIIYPRNRIIVPSTRIPEGVYNLILGGDAVAGIDVSPAISPRAKFIYQGEAGEINREKFSVAPSLIETSAGNCIVEPIAFVDETIFSATPGSTFGNINEVARVNIKTGVGFSPVLATTGYDASFTRGFLANPAAVDLLLDFHNGRDAFTGENNYEPTNKSQYPARQVQNNTDVELGNPLSYRWLEAGTHYQQLGAEKISNTSLDSTGVNQKTFGDEFESLRIAHRIDLPSSAVIRINGFSGRPKYPKQNSDFFRFPNGAQAKALNLDAGSWLAANPYIAKNLQGLKVKLTVGLLEKEIEVGLQNDGLRQIDIGGRSVLHYQRSERHEAMAPFSTTPIYTNVWIRLSNGGSLVRQDGGASNRIELPINTLLNPILGTYISDQLSTPVAILDELETTYSTEAIIEDTMIFVRPAYKLPIGTRINIGERGGELTNVKAAVFLSLAPLERTFCPSGTFNLVEGQTGELIAINQIKEGISENVYEDATGKKLSLGHPCLWLDDPENTDGDNIYVYRSRRRYVNENLKAITRSNDRVYVYGASLRLN